MRMIDRKWLVSMQDRPELARELDRWEVICKEQDRPEVASKERKYALVPTWLGRDEEWWLTHASSFTHVLTDSTTKTAIKVFVNMPQSMERHRVVFCPADLNYS